MTFIQGQNMDQVQEWGEPLPEGWYHVRVDKVSVGESKNTPGAQVVNLHLKVQEEPHVGAVIIDNPSLQPHALAKLKAYYTKCGYKPGPEGHDPDEIQGRECWVQVTHENYQGTTRMKIAPWAIRSMEEGKPVN